MHILFLTIDYPPFGWGGVATVVKNQSTGLAKLGQKVSVIAFDAGYLKGEKIRENIVHDKIDDVDVFFVHNTNLFVKKKILYNLDPLKTLYAEQFSLEILDMILTMKHFKDLDLIVVHNYTIYLGLVILRKYMKNKHIKIAYFCHAVEAIDHKQRIYNQYAQKIKSEIADVVIALCEDEKKLVEKHLVKGKAMVLGNCVQPLPLSEVEERMEELKKEFFRKTRILNPQLIVFLGRSVERKGALYVVKTIPKIMSEFPDAVYYMCIYNGSHEYRKKCIGLIPKKFRNRVIIETEIQPQKTVYALYNMGTVTVVPSYYEPFGLIPVEAMAVGCPVIAAEVGGMKGTVTKEVGLKLKVYKKEPYIKPKELERKIRWILMHPKNAKMMGEKGKERVKKHYNCRIVSKKLLRILRAVMKK